MADSKLATDAAIANVINKLTALTDAHGADALALGGRATQFATAHNMIWPAFLTLFAAGLAYGTQRLWSTFKTKEAAHSYDANNDGWGAAAVVCGVVGAIIGIIAVIGLAAETLSPLNWAILADWRLGLAAKVLRLL